jgi:hypothetical protein
MENRQQAFVMETEDKVKIITWFDSNNAPGMEHGLSFVPALDVRCWILVDE